MRKFSFASPRLRPRLPTPLKNAVVVYPSLSHWGKTVRQDTCLPLQSKEEEKWTSSQSFYWASCPQPCHFIVLVWLACTSVGGPPDHVHDTRTNVYSAILWAPTSSWFIAVMLVVDKLPTKVARGSSGSYHVRVPAPAALPILCMDESSSYSVQLAASPGNRHTRCWFCSIFLPPPASLHPDVTKCGIPARLYSRICQQEICSG